MIEYNLLGFPAFATEFKSETELVVSGGGGINKSGVANKIIELRISNNELYKEAEIDLSREEEAPMAIAIGRNEIISAIYAAKTANLHLRIFQTVEKEGEKVIEETGQRSIYSTNSPGTYIRVVRYSKNKSRLVLGSSDGCLMILNSMFKKIKYIKEKDEIIDVDFSTDGTKVFYCTPQALHVLHNGLNDSSVVTGKLRAVCCFGERVVCAVNNRIGKKNFACLIEYSLSSGKLKQGRKLLLSKQLLGVTGMALSDSGILALACGNLSIELCDIHSLKRISNIPNVHSIAITALSFSPSGNWLATTSVDSFVHVYNLEDLPKKSKMPIVIIVIILLFAILYQCWRVYL